MKDKQACLVLFFVSFCDLYSSNFKVYRKKSIRTRCLFILKLPLCYVSQLRAASPSPRTVSITSLHLHGQMACSHVCLMKPSLPSLKLEWMLGPSDLGSFSLSGIWSDSYESSSALALQSKSINLQS